MIRCLIGLGNPAGYELSRHNVGKIYLNYLSSDWKRVEEGHIGSFNQMTLFKTNTYMNICGPSVKGFLKRLGFGLEEILIVYDDVDLALGRVKVKVEGSASGHNGVRSLINSFGSDKFKRIRIGIGRPHSDDISDYVLSDFSKNELGLLNEASFPACDKIVFSNRG